VTEIYEDEVNAELSARLIGASGSLKSIAPLLTLDCSDSPTALVEITLA
jgi:hypothetical protein